MENQNDVGKLFRTQEHRLFWKCQQEQKGTSVSHQKNTRTKKTEGGVEVKEYMKATNLPRVEYTATVEVHTRSLDASLAGSRSGRMDHPQLSLLLPCSRIKAGGRADCSGVVSNYCSPGQHQSVSKERMLPAPTYGAHPIAHTRRRGPSTQRVPLVL